MRRIHSPFFAAVLRGAVVFLAFGAPTAYAAHRVTDLREGELGSDPRGFVAIGERVLFEADPKEAGSSILVGTEGELSALDGVQGPIGEAVVLGKRAVFVARVDGAPALLSTDGTVAETQEIASFAGAEPHSLTSFQDLVYFIVDGALWSTDGSRQSLRRIEHEELVAIDALAATMDALFISVRGRELWSLMGAASQPRKIARFDELDLEYSNAAAWLFFAAADDQGRGLWRSDGTEKGTVSVRQLGLDPQHLLSVDEKVRPAAAGAKVYFVARRDGVESLWVTDGQTGSSRSVLDLREWPEGSRFVRLASLRGGAVVLVQRGRSQVELWFSDGTAEKTHPVEDFRPRHEPFAPRFGSALNRRLYFAADDESGIELWETNGRFAMLTEDLYSGADSSEPAGMTLAGDKLYLSAFQPGLGRELVVLTVPQPDVTPPSLFCPADAFGFTEDEEGALVHYPPAIVDDASSVEITYCHETGSRFPIGVTEVEVNATDIEGNGSSCTFAVIVQRVDRTAPLLSCPRDQAVDTVNPAGSVVRFEANATDLQDTAPVIHYSHAPGSWFPVGQTDVDVTAIDASGNSAGCRFSVTVSLYDVEAPVIACSEEILATADASGFAYVALTAPEVHDALDPSPSVTCSHASGDFEVGFTRVECVARDRNGNSAECDFDVSVAPYQHPRLPTGGGCSASGGTPAAALALLALARFVRALRRRRTEG